MPLSHPIAWILAAFLTIPKNDIQMRRKGGDELGKHDGIISIGI